MKKGGYKIIDFKGTALSGTAVTRTDILASLKDNYGKVVLLTGIVIGDNAMDDCFSTPLPDGDDGFKLNAYDGYIAVTKAGAVTYTAESTDINTLNNKVTSLFGKFKKSCSTVSDVENVVLGLERYDSTFLRFPNTVTNDLIGISGAACAIATKTGDASARLFLFGIQGSNGKVATASVTKSGDVTTWSEKYLFEGTEYTPTP